MKFIFTVVANLVVLVSFSNAQITDDLVVSLNEPNSKIRGHVLKSFGGNDYFAFQDIPYAIPPLGEYRYAESKAHTGWEGILNTTSSTKACMQKADPQSTEDCLIINVYTTQRNSSAKLPVLVWIPGGAFEHGSSKFPSNNPERFIDYGVVIVSFNYRVGPLGFLTTEDGVIPGNLGLKDQILALKWIQKNIELFGGDPKKVTITGQSAGSISISCLVISQKATDLYRAAIMESGTGIMHGSFIEDGRNFSFQLGRNLDKDFTSNDSKDLLKLLRKASAADILTAAGKVKNISPNVGIQPDLFWGVVVENKDDSNALITQHMHSALENGHFDKVPIVIGYTSNEMFRGANNYNTLISGAAELDKNPANVVHAKWHIPEKDRASAGRKLKVLYTDKTFSQDLPAYVLYSSDIAFSNAAIRQADLASKSVPVYMYQFSYKGSPHQPVNISGVDGVGHAEELNYMWFTKTLDESDLVVSKRLITMWTNFIKDLNPTPSADSSLGIPIWPKLDPQSLTYLDIGSNLTIKKNPKQYFGVRAVFDQYQQPPFDCY